MKKFLILFLICIVSVTVVACASEKTDSEESGEGSGSLSEVTTESGSRDIMEIYLITFRQSGYDDQLREVPVIFTSLTDIPSPHQKAGYTVKWDVEDFSHITCSFTVNAIETPNNYTVTFDADGGYEFLYWTNKDNIFTLSAKWNVAENVGLKAVWKETEREQYSVTFIMNGTPTTVEEYEGTSFDATKAPSLYTKAGYTVKWSVDDLSEINETTTVYAVEIPNEYKIITSVDGKSDEMTVTYDSAYTLPTPEKEGYDFIKWIISGNGEEFKSGIYTVAGDTEITAVFEKHQEETSESKESVKESSDDDEWTKFY
ncbi:MAG: InlB B-repeat-containing protein [Clostridia bacterium]|nr:InlB B-repeat-containing protein [Clostridia bacterium]